MSPGMFGDVLSDWEKIMNVICAGDNGLFCSRPRCKNTNYGFCSCSHNDFMTSPLQSTNKQALSYLNKLFTVNLL